jgi:hypothetical protein
MTTRRFPAPWHADKMPGGYVVRDANGQGLAYLHSGGNDAEARQAKVLTKDKARRIAINIARLPELLGASGRGAHQCRAGLRTHGARTVRGAHGRHVRLGALPACR